MTVKEVGLPLVGELNSNVPIEMSGKPYLVRMPFENGRIQNSLVMEYTYMGFIGRGLNGGFIRRSSEEQIFFANDAFQNGLRALPAVGLWKDKPFYPLLTDAQPLDTYFQSATDEQIQKTTWEVIRDLRKAHGKNIIYGDRWSKNILVSPTWGVINVDFDLKLLGRYAKEFEIAQAAYYLISGGKGKAIAPLGEFFSLNKDFYDLTKVKQFIRRHAKYFNHTKYGAVEAEVETLIAYLDKKNESLIVES